MQARKQAELRITINKIYSSHGATGKMHNGNGHMVCMYSQSPSFHILHLSSALCIIPRSH